MFNNDTIMNKPDYILTHYPQVHLRLCGLLHPLQQDLPAATPGPGGPHSRSGLPSEESRHQRHPHRRHRRGGSPVRQGGAAAQGSAHGWVPQPLHGHHPAADDVGDEPARGGARDGAGSASDGRGSLRAVQHQQQVLGRWEASGSG